jgi:tRNA threonylcarbamoyl adenosine modification protein YeaZ
VLLAIDTSAGTAAAVVDAAGVVVAVAAEADTRRHAEVIGVLIRRVLDDARIRPVDIEAVVAGMGPGPFTGLRVGIAAARAFAAGIGRPVVPVDSHDAVALDAIGPTLVVTDARRREVAWSCYDGLDGDGIPRRLAGPGLARPDELPHAVPDYSRYRRIDAATIDAGALGRVGTRLRAAGRAGAPEPLYLRAPDVTPSAGKRVTP